MEYASDQPSAAEYAKADARRAQTNVSDLEKRVARIEEHLNLPPLPWPDLIEEAKKADAARHGREYP